MGAWYVAETLPRLEGVAQSRLTQQGFASFCPRFRRTRRHARRTDQVIVPLFPGYLFVRFDRDRDPWRSINGTRGVKRLVGCDRGYPRSMPEPAMAEIMARCDGEMVHGILPSLQPGQSVRLISGPFADMLGEITELDNHGRVRVLLDLLGGPKNIAIPPSMIASVGI